MRMVSSRLCAVLRAHRVAVAVQAAGGADDRRQRRAQVVRHRRQQRRAQALGLVADARVLQVGDQARADHRLGDVLGHRLGQAPLLGAEPMQSARESAGRPRRSSLPSQRPAAGTTTRSRPACRCSGPRAGDGAAPSRRRARSLSRDGGVPSLQRSGSLADAHQHVGVAVDALAARRARRAAPGLGRRRWRVAGRASAARVACALAARSASTCMRSFEARRPATSAATRNSTTVATPWRAPMMKVKRGSMKKKL